MEEDGGGMEEGWKRDGGGWRRDEGGMKERWRKMEGE